MRFVTLLAMATIFSSGFAQEPDRQTRETLDTTYSVKVNLNYLLALPEDYGKDPEKKWPVMLFLHGVGECGTDLDKVKVHGPPKLIAEGKDLPFIVVSPQSPSWDVGWSVDALTALLDTVEKKYRVDTDREYLTGLSMGGYGTWALAIAHPDRFAAIAPICGGGMPRFVDRLRGMGIWVFHGAKDPTVGLAESQEMVEALQAAKIDVKFTVYPEAGHDSWTEAYNNPELFDWFLTFARKHD